MNTTQVGWQYSGQAETGQPWQTDGSVFGIASNQAYAVSPTGQGNYARLDSSLSADGSVAITLRNSSFDGQAGFFARTSSDWYTYMAWVGTDSSGNVQVWELVNGTWSEIATGTISSPSYPLTLKATFSGTGLTVRANGFLVALSPSVTLNSTSSTSGRVGIYVDTTGTTPPKIDDFTFN